MNYLQTSLINSKAQGSHPLFISNILKYLQIKSKAIIKNDKYQISLNMFNVVCSLYF